MGVWLCSGILACVGGDTDSSKVASQGPRPCPGRRKPWTRCFLSQGPRCVLSKLPSLWRLSLPSAVRDAGPVSPAGPSPSESLSSGKWPCAGQNALAVVPPDPRFLPPTGADVRDPGRACCGSADVALHPSVKAQLWEEQVARAPGWRSRQPALDGARWRGHRSQPLHFPGVQPLRPRALGCWLGKSPWLLYLVWSSAEGPALTVTNCPSLPQGSAWSRVLLHFQRDLLQSKCHR